MRTRDLLLIAILSVLILALLLFIVFGARTLFREIASSLLRILG